MSKTPDRQGLAIIAGRMAETCLILLSSIAMLSLAVYAIALIAGRAW